MGDPGYQEISTFWQYRHPEVHVEEGDILCDAGIGSSASASKRYAQLAGPQGHVYAFEPIPSMCEKLVKEIDGVANLEIVPKGVWSETATSKCSSPATSRLSVRSTSPRARRR